MELMTKMVAMGLPQSISCVSILGEWVNMAQIANRRIIGEESEQYSLQRLNSVLWFLIVIQMTAPQGHPMLTLAG